MVEQKPHHKDAGREFAARASLGPMIRYLESLLSMFIRCREMDMLNMLLEKVLATESSFGLSLVQAGEDIVLVDVIDVVKVFATEDAIYAVHRILIKQTNPFGGVEGIHTSFVPLPSIRIFEGLRTDSALEGFHNRQR